MTEGSAKLRLVRCPKCEKLLHELPGYSLYQCGGCGAVLRAKKKVTVDGGILERSRMKWDEEDFEKLEAQNQSFKRLKNEVEFYNSHSLLVSTPSDYKTSHVPPDEIALEAGKQSVKRPVNEKTTKWVLLITSVLLEAMSAVFEQVGYALMGMVIAFLALFLSGLDLICKARKEGVKRSQPSGDLLDYYGLAAAVWQCFYSTMEYLYTRKNQQNPIKICLLPFMFALFVLLFSLFKCRT